MIIHISTWQKGLALELACEMTCAVGLVPHKEASWGAMLGTHDSAVDCEVQTWLDWQWHRDPMTDKPWFSERFGRPRQAIQDVEAHRLDFLRAIAPISGGHRLLAPSGPVNDAETSRIYASDAIQICDAEFPELRSVGTFTFDRQGLRDPAVVARMAPLPAGLHGLWISVVDTASYPSVWAEEDWYAWLLLIRTHVEAGYEVIAPYSDSRGVVGLGVGLADFGSGLVQELRQLRRVVQQQNGGPGQSTSYASVPLLAVIHGQNAVNLQVADEVESHDSCLPNADLDWLHAQGDEFDLAWQAEGLPYGQVTQARLRQHIRALKAAEDQIRSSDNMADATEELLRASRDVGTRLPGEVFRSPGTREELDHRLTAFHRLRHERGF